MIKPGGFAMSHEETIDAVIDEHGQLHLAQQPSLPPGPVKVTIRDTTASPQPGSLADRLREMLAERQAGGFVGRSAEEIQADLDEARREDDNSTTDP
jgi:hypothetical protein